VPRGVDYVKTVIFPETADSRRLNGNTALGFLFHKISSGFTFVNLTDFVDFTGKLKNTLCGGGLARINVRENTDVSI
jgi:hypothetical protein